MGKVSFRTKDGEVVKFSTRGGLRKRVADRRSRRAAFAQSFGGDKTEYQYLAMIERMSCPSRLFPMTSTRDRLLDEGMIEERSGDVRITSKGLKRLKKLRGHYGIE